MKKIGVIILSIVLVLTIFFMLNKNKEVILDNVKIKEEVNRKITFAMYKENSNGEYEEVEGNTFPTEGYILNEGKSKCIDNNGNEIEDILSYDVTNKKVIVDTNSSSYCYLYFDSIIHSLVPVMSSSSNGDITISSSPVLPGGYYDYYAFDKDVDKCWGQNSWTVSTGFLQIYFNEKKVVNRIKITNCNNYYGGNDNYSLKEFYFQASNDNSTWINLLHTTNNLSNPYDEYEYSFANNTAYNYYRIKTVSAWDWTNGTDRVVIGELELFGYKKKNSN